LICIVIAVSSVLADEALMKLLARIFKAPDVVKSLFFAAVAFAFYYWGLRRKRRRPEKIFSTEAILFLGVLSTAVSVFFFGLAIDTGSGHFSILLLISALIYAAVGLLVQSKLIWIYALLTIGSWFWAETGYASGWGVYYLGMNVPLRFVLLGRH
jgi:sensor histidine kinase YesM